MHRKTSALPRVQKFIKLMFRCMELLVLLPILYCYTAVSNGLGIEGNDLQTVSIRRRPQFLEESRAGFYEYLLFYLHADFDRFCFTKIVLTGNFQCELLESQFSRLF